MSKMELIVEAAANAFESERDRRNELQGKAEKLIAGIVAVTGFQLFDFKVLGGAASRWISVPSWGGLVLLAVALLVTLFSMKTQPYVDYPRRLALLNQLGGANVTEEATGAAIARVVLVARERNATINDWRAEVLRWALWLILAGFVSTGAGRLAFALI